MYTLRLFVWFQVFSGTLAPNDILVLPSGWLCIERSLESSSAGLKRTFYDQSGAPAEIENTKGQKSLINRLVQAVVEKAASRIK